MFGPLSPSIGLILGFLLVLISQPTTGFTVKLLGGENTFGETLVARDLDEVPIPDDDLPGYDEQSLDMLSASRPMPIADIDDYLMRFGYLATPANGSVSEHGRKEAIREFQSFTRLRETGVVDTRTRKQMLSPRCGMADPVSNSKFANFNAKATRKWHKKELTYRIVNFSKKISNQIVKEWTAKSFKMWADATQLTFKEVETGPSDIRVRFSPQNHGDGSPFDGRGGVLGHAFYPQNGEIHMDEAENWTVKSRSGTNLLFVLVHEIGHALGLGHSKVNSAIMEPYYSGYIPNLALDKDDIAGIQFLYGKPLTSTVAPPKPKPTTEAPVTKAPVTKAPATEAPVTKAPATGHPITPTYEPGFTEEPNEPKRKFPCPFKFWAAMAVGDKTYAFMRKQIFEILPNGKILKPRSISSIYRKGPSVVLAAAHNEKSGHTFLFVGKLVWRYTDNKLDEGFPKKLDYFIRSAVVVDDVLIAFSFTHVHYLDEDTMEDFVDGEVTIKEEYPILPRMMKSLVSYGNDFAYVLYKKKVIKLDMFTGEGTEEKC